MKNTLNTNIAELVREHRKCCGLTQKQLATYAGVGNTVIFDIEKGKQTIRLDTLLKVLHVLNIQWQFKSPLRNRQTSTKDPDDAKS